MAFTGAQNADASNSTFNDVRQNQYNVGTIHLASSPCLTSAISEATFTASIVKQAQASREQMAELAFYVDVVLRTLDGEYLAGRLVESRTSAALENLNRSVDIPVWQMDPLIAVQLLESVY